MKFEEQKDVIIIEEYSKIAFMETCNRAYRWNYRPIGTFTQKDGMWQQMWVKREIEERPKSLKIKYGY